MRILQITDRLNIGGAEKVLVNLANMLHDKKQNVAVLVFIGGAALEAQLDASIPVHDLHRKSEYSLLKLFELNRHCRQYEIVHVHMRHCYAYVRLAKLLFGGKFKIIFHDHYGDIEEDKSAPWHVRGLFRPKYYIGVSNTLTEWAKSILHLPGKYVFHLPNTIIPDNNIVYRNNTIDKRVLIVSNIRPTKNILFAVRLLKRLQLPADIYGNISDEAYHNELIKEIGTADIKIVEGVVDFKDVYNRYTLALHCAISETGPLVLLEYLAYGIPFVAYRTGDVAAEIASILPKHFTGNFDMGDWEHRIDSILNTERASEGFKEIFDTHFAPERYIERCLEIYKSVSC